MARKLIANALLIVITVCCMGVIACTGKKGHCAECRNDSECESGECATFVTNSGDRYLLCGSGSSSGRDSCDVPR